jgi:hypothetical protein
VPSSLHSTPTSGPVPSSLHSTPTSGPTPKKNRGGGHNGREGGKVLGADDDGEWSANARREHQHREGAKREGGRPAGRGRGWVKRH